MLCLGVKNGCPVTFLRFLRCIKLMIENFYWFNSSSYWSCDKNPAQSVVLSADTCDSLVSDRVSLPSYRFIGLKPKSIFYKVTILWGHEMPDGSDREVDSLLLPSYIGSFTFGGRLSPLLWDDFAPLISDGVGHCFSDWTESRINPLAVPQKMLEGRPLLSGWTQSLQRLVEARWQAPLHFRYE